MENKTIIRILAGLSFIIFFCPFFQMCADNHLLHKTEVEIELVPISAKDTVGVNQQDLQIIHDTIFKEIETPVKQNKKERQLQIARARKEYTYNFYELNAMILTNIDDQFQWKDFLDSMIYFSLFSFISGIISVIIAVSSFQNKYKLIWKLSITNLIFIFAIGILFYYFGDLEDLSQIKFGYYLFILNTIATIVFSRRQIQAANIN